MPTSSALPAHPAPGPSVPTLGTEGEPSALLSEREGAAAGDAGPELQLERLTGLAARVAGAPAALLVLLDERRAVRTVAWGLSEPLHQARDVAAVALCRAALTEATPTRPLAVAAAASDAAGAAELRALGVAAHAVVPLRGARRAAGALCAFDTQPRTWTPEQLMGLRDVAAALEHELAMRAAVRAAGDEQRRVEAVLASISDAFFAIDRAWRFSYVNDRAEQLLQRTRGSLLGRTLWDEFPAATGSLFEREYRRAMATDEPVAFEAYYPPPLDAWYEVRAYPGREGLAVYFQEITERRRAADALAESEARFRAVQDASPDGSIVMRAMRDDAGTIVDFRFTYANASAARILLDRADEQIVGRTMTEAFPDSVEAGRLAVYRRVAETGEPWLKELFFERGGVHRGLRVSAVRLEDGVHLGFADLSDRIRADAERERLLLALQEQRALTDAVSAQLPTGLIVVDVPSGRLRFANAAAERLLGHPMIPSSEVADYGAYGGVHEDGRPYGPLDYPLARAVAGEVVEQHLMRYVRGDGRLAQLSVSAAPVRGTDGQPTHAVCTMTDVSAREETAERTRQLQHVSAALAAAVSPTAVTELFVAHAVRALGAFGGSLALVEPDGVHARFAHAIGYPEEEVARWRTFPLSLSTPFGDAIRGRAVVVVSGDDEWSVRYPHLVPSSRVTMNTALVSLPLLVGERAVGVVGLGFHDPRVLSGEERTYLETLAGIAAQALDRAHAYQGEHAARAEAEEARLRAETARREAESANAVKAEFLATMSHELRTPLNAIGGYAQLIEMGVHGPVTDEQLQALARVQRSQQHLLGLINSVLNYAKLEAGKVTYELETLPADEIVRAVEALVAPQARAKGLMLTVEPCDEVLVVRADLEKARQVVLNLLSNAIKFTRPGGSVTVACTPAPPHANGTPMVGIAVVDTGRGIALDQLPRVFDPFVQVGRRLTTEDEGTGLGLAISRDLARGMGGDLTARSVEGEGSTFVFALPAGSPAGV